MPGRERQEETPRVPLIVIRVQAATPSLDQFVIQHCRHFGVDVLFLPTRALQPPGSRVRFVFALDDGEEVVTGEGVVLRTRRDSGDGQRPAGMELRYHVLDEGSQRVVDRMIALRASSRTVGVAPEPPPYASMSLTSEGERQRAALPKLAPSLTLSRTAVLPANPFADVSVEALDFFVEWSLEPGGDRRRRPRATRRHGVALVPPPRRGRGLRRFSVGLAMAVALVLAGGRMAPRLYSRRPAPQAAATPVSDSQAMRSAVAQYGVGGNASPIAAGPRPVAIGGVRPSSPRSPARDARALLSVETTPPGSTLFVDGQLRGRSPLVLTLTSGAHDVVAERPRYAPVHAHVDGPGRILLTHERPAARLRVVSTPPGARVQLDGELVGTTPLERSCAGYELHQIVVELAGHVSRRRVYVKPPTLLVRVDWGLRSAVSR